MPTYKEIQTHTRSNYGFVPKTCWIAHVKADYGLTKRNAPNRQDAGNRLHPCPPSRRSDLEASMRELGILN